MTNITPELISQWKEKFGRVRKLSVDGIEYYYRSVTLDEYYNIENVVAANEGAHGEVETVRTGLLEPELPANPPAGLVLKLSDEILKLSGFVQDGPPEEL